jgi:hypothetical protein
LPLSSFLSRKMAGRKIKFLSGKMAGREMKPGERREHYFSARHFSAVPG